MLERLADTHGHLKFYSDMCKLIDSDGSIQWSVMKMTAAFQPVNYKMVSVKVVLSFLSVINILIFIVCVN